MKKVFLTLGFCFVSSLSAEGMEERLPHLLDILGAKVSEATINKSSAVSSQEPPFDDGEIVLVKRSDGTYSYGMFKTYMMEAVKLTVATNGRFAEKTAGQDTGKLRRLHPRITFDWGAYSKMMLEHYRSLKKHTMRDKGRAASRPRRRSA